MSRVSRLFLLCSAALATAVAAAPVSASPSYALVHSFAGATSDGDKPVSELIANSSGRLYGTTSMGGAHFAGTAFRLTKNGKTWNEEILFSFPSGYSPSSGGLLLGPSGELYGTTTTGGAFGAGTVYRLDQDAGSWSLTTLHAFNPTGAQDGYYPSAGLAFGKDGLLYGTTVGQPPQDGQGSSVNPMFGTVFSVSPQGDTIEYAVLHVFGGTNDGQFPYFGRLSIDKKGILTGTTALGGKFSDGVAFQLAPPKQGGAAWKETVLHDFATPGTDLEAIGPFTGVVSGAGGAFYGCAGGGRNGNGAVYALTPPLAHSKQWGEQVIYNFGDQTNDPRANATCAVTINKGVLFGTASGGGANGTGAIFRVDPPAQGQSLWTETVLHSFGAQGSGDATFPGTAPIHLGKSLYGAAPSGGTANRGAIYEITP